MMFVFHVYIIKLEKKVLYRFCCRLTGIDVTANQEEETDKETFQMEYQRESHAWAFRTIDNKYWSLDPTSAGVQAKAAAV